MTQLDVAQSQASPRRRARAAMGCVAAALVGAALAPAPAAARTPTPTDGPSPTVTRTGSATPTGTPPIPVLRAVVSPNPARSGQRVTLDASGSNGSWPHWSQVGGDVAVPIEHADALVASFIVPTVSETAIVSVRFEMLTFAGPAFLIFPITLLPADAVVIRVGDARGAPGGRVQMEVTLDPLGLRVGALHHEIGFAPEAAIADRGDGIPDCDLGPGVDSGGFHFLPNGCLATGPCSAIAAEIGATANPIEVPGVVYRCRVVLTAEPADTCEHQLTCAGGNATAADGTLLALSCSDGTAVSAFEPQDPTVSLRVEPSEPLIGEIVHLTFSVSGDGGIPRYLLFGVAPFLSGQLSQTSNTFGDVTFDLQADCPGTAYLQLEVDYETTGGCPGQPFPFYFRSASSPVFALRVRDPAGAHVGGHVAASRDCLGTALGVTVTLEPLGRAQVTGRDGAFGFDAVPPGDYTLTVTPLCNPSGCWPAQSVHVESDDVPINLCPGERQGFCSGDCNNDGQVNITELILSVRVALGEAPALSCAAADFDASGVVQVNELVTAVSAALEGCPPPIGATATPSATPMPTPTSCRAVVPLVAPVTSPTDALEQTIYLCGIYYASSLVNVEGPTGEPIELYESAQCPLQCTDSRQRCQAADVPLLPAMHNTIRVCQVPGIGCGPLPDLCVEVEIEQRAAVGAEGHP